MRMLNLSPSVPSGIDDFAAFVLLASDEKEGRSALVVDLSRNYGEERSTAVWHHLLSRIQ